MINALQLHIGSFSSVVDRQISTAVEDSLAELYQVPVTSSSTDSEPPAAGMTEIALTILVSGAATLLAEFFKPLITDAGEACRNKVMDVIRNGRRSKKSGRKYLPLLIALGNDPDSQQPSMAVRYYFHGRLDDDDLLVRLMAANDHVASIPVEVFEGTGGPAEVGFYWDEQQNRWRGGASHQDPEQTYGEFWLPKDLWED